MQEVLNLVVERDSREDFLRRIEADRGNNALRENCAEWLDSQGLWCEAAFIRAEMTWERTRSGESESELYRHLDLVDHEWAARLARPPIGVCIDLSDECESSPRNCETRAFDLREVERRLNIDLPADYAAFQMTWKGVRPRPNGLRIPGRAYATGCSEKVLRLFQASFDSDADFQRINEPWMVTASHVAIGLLGNPYQGDPDIIYLGVQGQEVGQIVVAHVDANDAFSSHFVAPSFAAFLGMLRDYSEHSTPV